jgi:hypothetical protein
MIYNLMDLTSEVNLPVCGWKAISYEFQSLQLLSGKPSMSTLGKALNALLHSAFGGSARPCGRCRADSRYGSRVARRVFLVCGGAAA